MTDYAAFGSNSPYELSLPQVILEMSLECPP
jgi:hypothetical protein